MLSSLFAHVYAACTAKYSPYYLNSVTILKMQKDIDCKLAYDMKIIICNDSCRDAETELGSKIAKLAIDEYDRFVKYEENYLAEASKRVVEGGGNFVTKRPLYERGVADPPPPLPMPEWTSNRGAFMKIADLGPPGYYSRRYDDCVLFAHLKQQTSYSYDLLKSMHRQK